MKNTEQRRVPRVRGRCAAALAVVVAACCGCAATASHPSERELVKFMSSGKVLPSNLPFSEAVRVGDTLYLSGQIPIVPGTLTLVSGGTREEARQTMQNVKASLEANGYTMGDLVKCTVMLADLADWDEFNEVYKTYFKPGRYPARSAFGANGLALGARVEVECIAARSVPATPTKK